MAAKTSSNWLALSILGLGLVQTLGVAADTSVADKVAQLRQATTQVARLALLQDSDFVFDFINPPAGSGESTGSGGHTVAASASNFPALIGNDMAATVGFLGPCGMNTPHTHPRATEFNYVTNGTLIGGVLAENGVRFIENKIPAGSATIFPAGAIHFEFNDDCEPSTFVAFFNDVDPGVVQIAQRFFGLPVDVVDAALGGIGVVEIAGLAELIPNNIVLGLEECVKRCGLNRGNELFGQQQPRNQFNALPSGFGQPPSSTSTGSPTPSSSGSSSDGDNVSGAVSSNLDVSNPFSDEEPNRPLIIGLIAACGVMALGYIGLAIAALLRRKKSGVPRGSSYVRTGEQYAPSGTGYSDKYDSSESHGLSTPYDAPSGRH